MLFSLTKLLRPTFQSSVSVAWEFESRPLDVSHHEHQSHVSLKEPASPDWPSDFLHFELRCPQAVYPLKTDFQTLKIFIFFLPLANADLRFIDLYGCILYVTISKMHPQEGKLNLVTMKNFMNICHLPSPPRHDFFHLP